MTSGTGNKRIVPMKGGFTLIEVLVASVILFVGLGAVLKAYSVALSALDASEDLLAASSIFHDCMTALELQAATGAGAMSADRGAGVVNGVEYRKNVTLSARFVAADLDIQSAVMNVVRAKGGLPRTTECEWLVFHEKK